MQQVIRVVSVLRQRGIINRSFSKKWSLTLCQSDSTRKSPFLQTEYYSGYSRLLLARYPDRQLLSVLGGARFFARQWKRLRNNPSPECDLVPLRATVVPKVWSHVPVIATTGVVFPLFKKYIEISNPVLIALIRRKIKLNEPYVGIFLKKEEDSLHQGLKSNLILLLLSIRNEADVVESLDDIYSIGTFAQVTKIKDMGNQLALGMETHRRIKIVNQIVENHQLEQVNPMLPEVNEQTFKLWDVSSFLLKRHPVLMVEVVNLNDEYEQSEELKAVTQEINGIILDLYKLNTTFRFHRRMFQKHSVVDNPSYLSDLGAFLCFPCDEELQEVLEEMNILKRLKMSLALLKNEIMEEIQQEDKMKIKERVTLQDQIYFLHQQIKAIKNDLILIKYNTYQG